MRDPDPPFSPAARLKKLLASVLYCEIRVIDGVFFGLLPGHASCDSVWCHRVLSREPSLASI